MSALCRALGEVLGDGVVGGSRNDQQALIAALLPNDYPLFELFFVAAGTRTVLLPLNTRLSPPEISRILSQGAPRVLVIDRQWQEVLEELDLPASVVAVVWVGGAAPLPSGLELISLSYASIIEHQPPTKGRHYPAPSVEDPGGLMVEIFNTSGTTGLPKMVPHTHANVSNHLRMTLKALGLGEDPECWGHFGPMYHVGDVAFVWAATAIGARHVFHPQQLRFEDVARVMSEQEVTITKLVPTMLRFLVQSETVRRLDFSELKWILTGGDRPERALIDRTGEVFGCQFIQGYGMTEATCHVAFRNESEYASAGGLTVLEGLEVQILDEVGASLPPGEIGEISIRGPNVFGGYLNNPGENQQRFTRDGFFRSGDLGCVDESGGLRVSGRKKDMIIVGGENVFARDIEQVANALPGIRASAAVGIADEVFGEVVALAVIPDDEGFDEASIIRSLRPKLASFKVPQKVFVFDAFPMTPTGKVKKQEIRQEIAERIEDAGKRRRSEAGARTAAARVRSVLTDTVGAEAVERADPDRPLLDINIDSLGMASLIVGLEHEFGLDLPYWFILEHDSINALIAFFERSPEARQTALDCSAAAFEDDLETAGAEESMGQEGSSGAAAPDRRRTGQWMLNGLLQCGGLLLRPALALFSLLPAVWTAIALTGRFGLGAAFAAAPLILFGSSLLALTFLVAVKWLIVGRLRPGSYETGTPFFYRWLIVHNLFASTTSFLGVYRGTVVLNGFFRLCGARIGHGAVIHTLFLTEPDLVSVGEGAVIDRKANLQPSLVSGNRLQLDTIQVGKGAAVGYSASLGPGSEVPDETWVPPLATTGGVGGDGRVTPLRPPVNRAAVLLSFVLLGYLCAAAILLGFFFTEGLLERLGIDLGRFHFYGPLSDTALVLGAVALARFGVLPVIWFVMVTLIKRLALAPLKPDTAWSEHGAWRRYGNWLYGRLIDVPFFDWALQLTNMSALTVFQFRLLGARIGRHVFFTAPYTTEPELLQLDDETMIAGNVALFPANRGSGKVSAVRLDRRAAVANSAVLLGGTRLGQDSLFGDLSVAPPGFVLQAQAIAVGNPPRIVGRTDFDNRTVRGFRFVAMQSVLVALQLVFGLGATVMSWVALTPVIALLSENGPYWWEFPTIGPLLLLAPGLFTLAAIPLAKLLLVRRFRPGDYPLFGWLYVRWTLLETLLGRVEESVTSQFNGTVFARVFYEAMGARLGEGTWLMGSPIGGEFDLKEICDGVALNHQSKIFAHSIKRHSLIFEPASVQDGATLRPFAIVEAGAAVQPREAVGDAVAFHAARDASGRSPYEKRYLNLREVEALAERDLPRPVFDYFAGGAVDEYTLRRNETIYTRYQIVPRVLRDVSEVDTRCRFLEAELSLPLMVAPVAMQKLAHADGEVGIARAARLAGIPYVLSSLSTTALEDVAAVGRRGDLVTLFQLYCLRDRGVVEDLIARAERSGYRGLVLTVDAPVSGKREQDMHNQFAVRSDIRFPNLTALEDGPGAFHLARFDREIDPALKWDILDWIRARTQLPVLLKGVLSHQDAVLAVEHDADGIIVSNHGGRQLDTTPAAIEVLPEICRAVRPRSSAFPIFIDGGIRRGTDLFKAVALGASGALVGRPCVYGLAVDGYAGAARVLTILKEEFVQTMRLAGCRSLDEIEASMVRPPLEGQDGAKNAN